MKKYLVTFHKVIPDETGRDRHVPDRQAVVCASSAAVALREAQVVACQTLALADWRQFADGCDVAEMADAV